MASHSVHARQPSRSGEGVGAEMLARCRPCGRSASARTALRSPLPRFYYPFVFAYLCVEPFPGMLTSTVPAYWCVWWMVGATVLAAARL